MNTVSTGLSKLFHPRAASPIEQHVGVGPENTVEAQINKK